MKILVIGAEGQLGLEICNQLKYYKQPFEWIAVGRKQVDLTNPNQIQGTLQCIKPDIIINCAAYTAVDQSEEEIETAYLVNAIGPKHLAIEAEKLQAKLVHISTDYVFSGDMPGARREDDVTGPQSIYGSSKLLGEEYVKTFCKKHFIIRTAWLYGEGNNFVRTMLKLAETNKELSVVGDQFGSPTSTKDLAKVIIELMQTEYYGTFHGTCEGECTWYEFASKIFELKGIDIKVNRVTSEEFVRPAKRPKYSVLDNFMLKLYGLNSFRHWEDALKDYLEVE